MKIEKLDISNNKLKLGILIGVLLTASIFILINYLTSRANYRNTESIELAKGTINYSMADLNVIAMYKIEDGKDVEITEMPGKEYQINTSKSYCYTTNKDDHDTKVTLSSDNDGNIVIGNLKKGSKCIFYFEYNSTPENMLAKLEARTGKQYITSPMPAISAVDTSSSTGKLYTAEDNYGISYVFRGDVQDNWVTFANKSWRIIRINGDGTLRLIYQCGSASCQDTNGTNTRIGYISYNLPNNDNTHVGYYIVNDVTSKYPEAHQGTTPSTVAEYVNSWYSGEGDMTNYTKYISGNTGFCNDRQISQISRSNYSNTGFGRGSENATIYAETDRFISANLSSSLGTQTPDLRCGVDPKTKAVDKSALQRDLYTTGAEAGNGNGILQYPVGLITVDEVAMAGGKSTINNLNYYLYTGYSYWTMSPSSFSSSASVFFVGSSGSIDNGSGTNASFAQGVRPVINLKGSTTFSGGNGLVGSPFVVATD